MNSSDKFQKRWKSLYFLVAKTGFKGLVFLYTILVARSISASLFSEFQLLIGLVNILVQPSIVLSLFVSRSGWESGDSQESQISRLKAIHKASLSKVLWLSVVVGGFLCAFFPVFSHFFGVDSFLAYFSCVAMVVAFLIMNYFLGFAQATQDFQVMGTIYLVTGAAIVIVTGGALYFFNSSLEMVLVTQLFGYCLGAGLIWLRSKKLFRNVDPLPSINFKQRSYYFALTSCLVFFFLHYFLDIYVVKSVMDEESTNTYIRIAFIGKIAFIISSTLGVIVFPKASMAVEKGESAREYFFKGLAVFLVLSVTSATGLYFASNDLLQMIFKIKFDESGQLFRLLIIILSASVAQAVIFFLIHYSMAKLVRWPAWLMMGLLGLQLSLNLYDSSTLEQIAINSLVPGLVGVIAYLGFIFAYRTRRHQSAQPS